jgi:hypothetical protein
VSAPARIQTNGTSRGSVSAPVSAAQAPSSAGTSAGLSDLQFIDSSVTPAKRKPGRPKGSKTKKPRLDMSAPAPAAAAAGAVAGSQYPGFKHAPPGPQPPPTSAYPEVNAHNKQYYDFQWRVLNLCSEFYLAAEQLLVSRRSCISKHNSRLRFSERGVTAGHRSVLYHGSHPRSRPHPAHP